MKNVLVILIFLNVFVSFGQYDANTTPTYHELIAYFKKTAAEHKEVELYQMGDSDYGLPIYVCIINGAGDSLKTFEKARKKTTILINNAIHPGEPDGVNACILWMEDWIKHGKHVKNLPLIAMIPVYNVGGMMNRSSSSRANQEGPEEYGFRGNAQNLDLNRDFIKMDSRNMFTFAKIYHGLDPDVFVDTHVSNGADYQYVLTLISSMKERTAPSVSSLTSDVLIPEMEKRMKHKNIELFPYVELIKETPEEGIMAFNDLPRYAMGYASLFNTISFTVETHMLKPFPQRVQATKEFLNELIYWTNENHEKIEKSREEAFDWQMQQSRFKFNYQLTEQKDSIEFAGFEHVYKKSEVTGVNRLFYDRNQPFRKYIPYYKTYAAKDSVMIPQLYIIGGQCDEIINRLKANKVIMTTVEKDTLMDLICLRVDSYKSSGKPYEGHFIHSESNIEEHEFRCPLKKGDIIINPRQKHRQFILSVLEPRAEDSYFNWNFFDSYLQQKEYFSPYVFEEKAKELLDQSAELRAIFEEKRKSDPLFSEDGYAQLYFIYRNSVYFEPTVNRLPLMKIF